MKANYYHLGIYRDNKTIVLQAVKDVDQLNCECIEYFGVRQTTKNRLKENKAILLAEFKKMKTSLNNCNKIRIE